MGAMKVVEVELLDRDTLGKLPRLVSLLKVWIFR